MAVDDQLGDARGRRDLLHRGPGEAPVGEGGRRAGEDREPPVGPPEGAGLRSGRRRVGRGCRRYTREYTLVGVPTTGVVRDVEVEMSDRPTTNLQVRWTEDELLAEQPGLEPLVIAGRRCHGGLDADGEYHSPRSRFRNDAIAAWQARHRADFGTDLLDAGLDTWPAPAPNVAQSRLPARARRARADHGGASPASARSRASAGAMRLWNLDDPQRYFTEPDHRHHPGAPARDVRGAGARRGGLGRRVRSQGHVVPRARHRVRGPRRRGPHRADAVPARRHAARPARRCRPPEEIRRRQEDARRVRRPPDGDRGADRPDGEPAAGGDLRRAPLRVGRGAARRRPRWWRGRARRPGSCPTSAGTSRRTSSTCAPR